MAIAAGRVVTATRGVWLAGGEGRRPRRVVQAAWSLARTCSCGRSRRTPNVRAVAGCARTCSCGRACVDATRGVRQIPPRCHTCGSYRRPNNNRCSRVVRAKKSSEDGDRRLWRRPGGLPRHGGSADAADLAPSLARHPSPRALLNGLPVDPPLPRRVWCGRTSPRPMTLRLAAPSFTVTASPCLSLCAAARLRLWPYS